MGQDFYKLFKNTTVVYANSKVDYLHRVGLSVKISPSEPVIEIYREEGKLVKGSGSSRGKLSKIRFRGEPSVKGLCKLLSLDCKDGRIAFFQISEVFVSEGRYATFTERVSFTELSFELSTGKVVKLNKLNGKEEVISQLEPAKDVDSFLRITPELWRVVDSP